MPDKSLLAAMAGVGAGGGAAILLGFMLHDAYPRIPDEVFGALIALTWAALAFGIFFAINGPFKGASRPGLFTTPPKAPAPIPLTPEEIAARDKRREEQKQEAARTASSLQEAKRLRIAELAADPTRSKYVPLMERGEWWSDEQIAYQENPQATATCVHLQPVERAMRSAGIVPRLLTEPWYRGFTALPSVRADCSLNEPELRRLFPLPDSVRYATGFHPDRWEFDDPWAKLSCVECSSAIDMVHPEWRLPATVWFPVAPK